MRLRAGAQKINDIVNLWVGQAQLAAFEHRLIFRNQWGRNMQAVRARRQTGQQREGGALARPQCTEQHVGVDHGVLNHIGIIGNTKLNQSILLNPVRSACTKI